MDKGIGFVRDFILLHFEKIIHKAINNEIVLDFKTKLQELLQQDGEVVIHYDLIKYEGPPHSRKFFINVVIDNKIMGEGYSKKEAEQNAAKAALKILGEINE